LHGMRKSKRTRPRRGCGTLSGQGSSLAGLLISSRDARQPRSYPVEDYALGYWQGEAIVSRLDWEIKLGQLVGLVDQVFDRCESTLDATPPALCCWLKSFTRHRYYPKPFRPLQRQRANTLPAYWKRYICFLFRSWLLEADFRADIYGYNIQSCNAPSLINRATCQPSQRRVIYKKPSL